MVRNEVMTSLSLAETHALAELAGLFYDFLPGSTPSARGYTWQTLAEQLGLGQFWPGGSKRPAINRLLEGTLQHRRDRFCDLILLTVREGIKYRAKGDKRITREEIRRINEVVALIGFKVPDLHSPSFLGLLPSEAPSPPHEAPTPTAMAPHIGGVPPEAIGKLHQRFLQLLVGDNPHSRGYALEGFLTDLFGLHGLAPRGSFRVAGEQIDDSFEWQSHVFLVEARWREQVADTKDLLVLRGKVEGKSDWTRGLFLSINGFSVPAADTFRLGRRANLITMDGQDLILILEDRWSLHDAIRVKLRHAGETGEVHLPLATASS